MQNFQDILFILLILRILFFFFYYYLWTMISYPAIVNYLMNAVVRRYLRCLQNDITRQSIK